MRVFVTNSKNEKIYLTQIAANKKELAVLIGSEKFEANGGEYSVEDVRAEYSDNTAGSMALGGVVGVLGGVPGVIIGGLIGGILGANSKNEDERKAEAFNRSSL